MTHDGAPRTTQDGLFDLSEVPEVPLFREPRRSRGAAVMDARLDNDYPPEWAKCPTCEGRGKVWGSLIARTDGIGNGETVQVAWRLPGGSELVSADFDPPNAMGVCVGFRRLDATCPDCLGMGSVKARVRLEAGHRCVRCRHPFMTKGDAKMLGVEPSPGRWSPCDETCTHGGRVRVWRTRHAVEADEFVLGAGSSAHGGTALLRAGEYIADYAPERLEAEWRVLTVHHLDGDKSNLRWWNLVALDQRCHLEIQGRVVMDRVYPHEHSEWFKPFAAGYYAFSYLCKICSRRLDDGPWQAERPRAYLPGYENVAGPDGFPHKCERGLEITRRQALDNLDALLALERAA